MHQLRTIPRLRLLLLGTLVLWLAACASFALRQGWDPKFGPVIPHDSFPADCTLCHVGDDWNTIVDDFTFDHLAVTGVPLDGAHEQASCLRCHNDRGAVTDFTARGCAGCHLDPHAGKLGGLCNDCHNEQTWTPHDAIARHDRTRFPLIGAHASTACWRCHPGAQVARFDPLDTACVSCHLANYTSTSAPNHAAAGFGTACETCHTAVGWRPAVAAHPASFPLVGGHATPGCASCHSSGAFAGLSTDCSTCHLADYQAATPNHVAAGFSLDCAQCHDIFSFRNATLNHAFPLEGPHALNCNECHLSGSNFASFSCTHCHAHGAAEMADEHDDVGGYVWSSPSCYGCHPSGHE
ncbi:MAG: hypothetical protein ACYTF9_15025 [Planctomycetota bacterium]|jgi:hypothetical protein